MRINDRFTVTRDKLNWILTERWTTIAKKGKNTGKEITKENVFYFSNFHALAYRVLDLELDPTGGIKQMLDSLAEAKVEILDAIAKNGEPNVDA